MKIIMALVTSVWMSAAFAGATLNKVETSIQDNHFVASYDMGGPIDTEQLKLSFDNDGVAVFIPGATLNAEKNLISVKQNGIKSLLTLPDGTDQLRTKVFFEKGTDVAAYADSVRFVSAENGFKVVVKKPAEVWSTEVLGMTLIKPNSLDTIDQEIAGQTISKADAAVITSQDIKIAEMKSESEKAAADKIAAKSEKEIPVLTTVKNEKVSAKNSTTRLVLSFAIVIAFAFGAFTFSKWYSKRAGRSGEASQIRVLTQHHLGPRKSLAIIRVAGESILIGVTDQNISMIKSLSLIDDEFPEVQNKASFAATLQSKDAVETTSSKFAQQKDDAEDFVLGNIKDQITTKIKDLRSLS